MFRFFLSGLIEKIVGPNRSGNDQFEFGGDPPKNPSDIPTVWKDRVIQGVIAGVFGWLPEFAFMMVMYFGFHRVKLRFLDFAGILAFAHRPVGWFESIYAESIVIAQMAGLGILFIFLLPAISPCHLRLKGGIYGGFTWFVIYVLAVLNKVKGIYGVVDFHTSLINFFGSIIWGVTLGSVVLLLQQKYGISNLTVQGSE